MIDDLETWLKQNHITYNLRRNDIIDIPEFGKCLFQSMEKREHIFKLNKETKEAEFNSIEDYTYLRNDDIKYIIFKFGNRWFYVDIDDDSEFHLLKYVGKPVTTETECDYYPLGIHTGFELLNGSGNLALWSQKAKFLGYKGISVCDKNTLASSLELQRETTAIGLKYCFGYSMTFVAGNDKIGVKIYSRTQEGFTNLLRMQYLINVVREEDRLIDITDLCNNGKGNVLVFDKLSGHWLADQNNDDVINDILDSFESVFFQVDTTEYKADRIDSQVLQSIKAYFDAYYFDYNDFDLGIEPVLIQDVYYADADDSVNKIVLNKIASGAAHEQSDKQYMKTLDELFDEFDRIFSDKYSEDLFYRMCENTCKIIEGADAEYDLNSNYMPEYEMTPEEKEKYGTNHNMFIQLIEEGFKRLVPEGEEEVYRKRIEYEKYVISSTETEDYFLLTYDQVNFARKNDILVGVGRGSAGGALLNYLLGITQIDPIKFNLIFERFLLPERAGLEADDVTKLAEDVESSNFIELTLENGKVFRFDKDSEFRIKRGEKIINCYADELEEGDDIIFDNINLIQEIK